MVEYQLPKLRVAGSNPVSRSNKNNGHLDEFLVPVFYVLLSLHGSFCSLLLCRVFAELFSVVVRSSSVGDMTHYYCSPVCISAVPVHSPILLIAALKGFL